MPLFLVLLKVGAKNPHNLPFFEGRKGWVVFFVFGCGKEKSRPFGRQKKSILLRDTMRDERMLLPFLFMLGIEGKDGVDELALLMKPIFLLASRGAADLHVHILKAQVKAVENGADVQNKQYNENTKNRNEYGGKQLVHRNLVTVLQTANAFCRKRDVIKL
jgi:hypothetical protein